MELLERLADLQASAEPQLGALNSKKKTENALLLPFFRALGYDPFDLREVEPEFYVGLEEQGMGPVDYALKIDGAPVMLVQCQTAGTDLGASDTRFLLQSFDHLEADVVVFTNGHRYRFYANLDAGLQVDGRPFLEFNLLDDAAGQIEDLKLLTRPAFDTEKILARAYEHNCIRLLRNYVARQQQSPGDRLVRFLAAQIYDGEVSDDVLEQFRPVVQNVLDELLGDEHQDAAPIPSSFGDTMEPADNSESRFSEDEATEASPPPGISTRDDAELSAPDDEPPAGGDEAATGEDELDGEDPFEKDLARRVIDDF